MSDALPEHLLGRPENDCEVVAWKSVKDPNNPRCFNPDIAIGHDGRQVWRKVGAPHPPPLKYKKP